MNQYIDDPIALKEYLMVLSLKGEDYTLSLNAIRENTLSLVQAGIITVIPLSTRNHGYINEDVPHTLLPIGFLKSTIVLMEKGDMQLEEFKRGDTLWLNVDIPHALIVKEYMQKNPYVPITLP